MTHRLHIVIRDDDVSYFSCPALLTEVYGPLWAAGLPVCLSIIPAHNSASVVPSLDGKIMYDPNIPVTFRGVPRHHLILDNLPLCDSITEKLGQGLVEVVLHGFSHTTHDFYTADRSHVRDVLLCGLSLMHLAFGPECVNTFVAPYDYLSIEAVEEVLAVGLNLCTKRSTLEINGILSPSFLGCGLVQSSTPSGSHLCFRGTANFVVTVDEYCFDIEGSHDWHKRAMRLVESALLEGDHFLIMVNHHWQFGCGSKGSRMLNAWNDFVLWLLEMPQIQVVSFRHLFKSIVGDIL